MQPSTVERVTWRFFDRDPAPALSWRTGGSCVSQKVPCSKCGVSILESTALRTDGLCMPCKGGYRESIDEGKRHIGEQRERMLTDPHRKLWVLLVELVHRSRAASMASHIPKNSILLSVSWKGTFTTVDFTNTSSTTRAHIMFMRKRVSSRSAHSRRLNYCRKPKTYCFLPS